MSALPGISDINLFCYRQSIVHFDAKVSNCAFDHGVPKSRGSSPTLPIQINLAATRGRSDIAGS
jgi:hypothetical protein